MARDGTFDLDRMIAEHLDSGDGTDAVDQAVAVLVDADIPPNQRATAFVGVMSELLSRLSADEFARFHDLAKEQGNLLPCRTSAR